MSRKPRKSQYDAFVAWAVQNGAGKEASTNPYEVVRLRVAGGVAVIYTNKKGIHTFSPKAVELWAAFGQAKPMPLRPVAKTKGRGKRSATIKTLIERDGRECFFCGVDIPAGEETIEHLVPRTHGGPDHLSNKFLADQPCNKLAGHLSAVEKIRLRDRLRAEAAAAAVKSKTEAA